MPTPKNLGENPPRTRRTFLDYLQMADGQTEFYDGMLDLLFADSSADWFDQNILTFLGFFRDKPAYWAKIRHIASQRRIFPPDFEKAVDAIRKSEHKRQGHDIPHLETLTDLLAADLPALHYIVDGLIHEGLWIFGGKSKRGKSWLMLDLAMAITAGRSAIGHFPTRQSPVLYLALEDGRRRVKHRALKIEPMIHQRDLLHLAYKFPRLQDGAIDHLKTLIDQYGFKLIIIDVAAKLTTATGKNSDAYMQVYEELGTLHDLCEDKHMTIILLDHLRKQQADDIFDEIQGTVAKQGVADALMVLDRKPDSDDALLHIRSKEAEDATHAIQFYQNSFRYIGEGEAHKLAKERYDILAVLVEQQSPMGLPEILKALGLENNSANYQRIRRILLSLENEDFVKRLSSRGNLNYLATIRAKVEGMPADYDDDPPF